MGNRRGVSLHNFKYINHMENCSAYNTELIQNNKLNAENFSSIGQILFKISFFESENNSF